MVDSVSTFSSDSNRIGASTVSCVSALAGTSTTSDISDLVGASTVSDASALADVSISLFSTVFFSVGAVVLDTSGVAEPAFVRPDFSVSVCLTSFVFTLSLTRSSEFDLPSDFLPSSD